MLGFGIPLALVALAMGPAQVLHWTVLGNGSYVSYASVSTAVLLTFVLMTLAWAACNLPILWRLPVAWRDRSVATRDGKPDTDLWLWLISAALSVMVGLRFFGHYYMQLVPPLVLLSAGVLARGSRRIAVVTVSFAAVMAIAFSAAGYFMSPFGPEPRYQAVSQYLETHTDAHDRIFVWGSEPEIYWASDRLPATRFVTTLTFLAGNHPGRDPEDAAPEDSSPGRLGSAVRRPRGASAEVPDRHRTGPHPWRRVDADHEVPAPAGVRCLAVPLRGVDQRDRHLRAQVTRAGIPSSDHRPGHGVVARVGLGQPAVAQKVRGSRAECGELGR